MNVTINNTYPIFEADQVLTADHLNEAVSYLEEQERLTRVKLIGMGIVCGLQARLADGGTAVTVSTGVAITSKGYLITFKGEAPDGLIKYPFFTPYADPQEDIYPFFLNGGAEIPLFELQEQKIQGAEPLGDLPESITNYGVLMYLECLDKKLKNCIENDCNEKGTERIFTLRVLLVRKEDMRNIICMESSLNGPKTEAQIDEFVNARFKLPGLQLPRVKLSPNIVTAEQLLQLYVARITTSLPFLQTALLSTFKYYNPILQSLYQGQAGFEETVTVVLPGIHQQVVAGNLCRIQYYYDLLCDLADTYNEFVDTAFDLWTACCPPMDTFPKHVRLTGLVTEESCEPSPYRTRFLHSPIHNGQAELAEQVRCLHFKIFLLIRQFQPVNNLQEIRITPSRELDERLTRRAIPAYYDLTPAFVRNWNPELKRRCRSTENLSYHASQYAQAANLAHIRTPLAFSIKEYDFLRIEGHLCRPFKPALQEIIRQRNANCLPFDVVALKVGTDASGTTIEDMKCLFKDLDTICRAWKKEIECMLGSTVGGLVRYNPSTVFTADTQVVTIQPYDYMISDGSIVQNLLNVINVQEGYLGNYVVQGIGQGQNDPCEDRDFTVNLIQENIAVADLPNQEYLIAVYYPATIATHIIDFARVIDRPCSELDLAALERSQARLIRKVNEYYTTLNTYYTSPNRVFNFDVQGMLRVMSILISRCTLERIRVIKAEIERRKEELRKMNLFSEYFKKHVGMEHAAGVPKGGTFIIVYTGEEPNSNTNLEVGTIIADFFLPYLCCSDCPPITYVFPDEAAVSLDIKLKDFCVPYDFTIYPFEVGPPDGEISPAGPGTGVLGGPENGYTFDPNQVDMGNEILRSLTFQVNGQDVPLIIRVGKTPDAAFESDLSLTEDNSGNLINNLILTITNYDNRYQYEWKLSAINADGSETPLPSSPISPNGPETNVLLPGFSEGGQVAVGLYANSELCVNSSSQVITIPPIPAVVEVGLSIADANFGLIDTTLFSAVDENLYHFIGTPGGGELNLENGEIAQFIINQTPGSASNVYQWTPFQKTPGVYRFTYNLPNGQAEALIRIQRSLERGGGVIVNNVNELKDKIESIGGSNLFSNYLKNSNAFILTSGLLSRFSTEWSRPDALNAYRAGEFNEAFAETMNKASDDVTARIIRSAGDNVGLKYLLEMYQTQLSLSMVYLAMLEEDINLQHPVSKLFTVYNNQAKKMKDRDIKLKNTLKFDPLLRSLKDALADKESAQSKVKGLLETIK